jgi:hypothetical protein
MSRDIDSLRDSFPATMLTAEAVEKGVSTSNARELAIGLHRVLTAEEALLQLRLSRGGNRATLAELDELDGDFEN